MTTKTASLQGATGSSDSPKGAGVVRDQVRRQTRTRASAAAIRDVGPALGAQRWIRREAPFAHVVAYDLFTPVVYQRLETTFLQLLEESGDPEYLSSHDIQGRTIDSATAAAFEPLLSRAFHDVLADVLGIRATGHVAAGMHHHRPGSHHGFPHNDLNRGWFLGQPGPDELSYAGSAIDYTSGRLLGDADGKPVIETVRAASLLFYLANPRWEPGDGGATGLYRSGTDNIEKPAAFVPPINNSMLLFECTPNSYHGFVSNTRTIRNSIVMWLHRPKEDVVHRWSEAAIVPYGLVPKRRGAR
jgi:hypothetical protein